MVGLFGSTVLEAMVGAASVYLILALFCSAVNEWIAHALDARAENFKRAMASIFPSRAFSAALIDLATSHVEGSVGFHDLEAGIARLPGGPVRRVLLALIQNTEGDLARAQANIENWFNDTMERASGWYRRRAQVWNLVLASLVVPCAPGRCLTLGRCLAGVRSRFM